MMKKSIRVIAAALALSILTACTGNSGTTSSAGSKKPSGSKAASVSADSKGSQGKVTDAQKASFEKFGHYGNPDLGYETMEGTRDAWTWPFSRDSIWNMPLGDGAVYKDTGWKFYNVTWVDQEYIWTTDKNDELLDIYPAGMGEWPEDVSKLKKYDIQTYWPRGVTISKDIMGNCCSAILQPDGRTIIQLQPTYRQYDNSSYIVGYPSEKVDIYGTGEPGTHWGSALSSIGGSIRLGELTSDEPIRHALKITVPGCSMHFDWKSMGYTWPATTADGAAADDYTGTNPDVKMGSLVALERNVTAESLGVTSPVAKKLIWTLQNYGAYVVDNAGTNCYNWCGDIQILKEVEDAYKIKMTGNIGANNVQSQAYYNDMKIIVENLKVITNSSQSSVGGGGKPVQPLAPDLPSIK